uniref:APRATAXIN-like protein n=1 Tax=Gymnema sylvestre TaxID=4068 RepID=A0A976X756_GYMSY|nr:APRATAXIN-like protein [Gymnema sylvestre]
MEPIELDRNPNPSEGQEQVEVEKGKPIVVILVGAPGSGKSTFCDDIIRVSTRPWVRICQDTIGNGKAGTRTQCLMSASGALREGKSVFIDRCNIDREQRLDFVRLGGPEVEKHAVVLDLPVQTCISRSVKRTNHEGNLEGEKAAKVVNKMLQKKEYPKLVEGYDRITCCQDEKGVQDAINAYAALGSLDTLPTGYFGPRVLEGKVQLGIERFFKKVVPAQLKGSELNAHESYSLNQVAKEKDSSPLQQGDSCTPSNHARKDSQDHEMGMPTGATALDGVSTLAFPSISTADFQFNLEKASDIIVEKVGDFVNKVDNARLVLVDLSHGSKILSLVRTKAEKKKIDSKKFFTFVGDITRLFTIGGLRCHVIANAANWRLKPGGGGVNAAIFKASGPSLETATKERAVSLDPGKALVVPLPSDSPLFSKEGVTHVIHVLGPNMNPQRPNCLDNDYVEGCKVLREAYSSLFEGFATILSTQRGLVKESDGNSLNSQDQKAKRDGLHEWKKNKKSKGSIKELQHSGSQSNKRNDNQDHTDSRRATRAWSSWAQALYHIAINPEPHEHVLQILDDVVVLNDVYPKAKRHLLVLARAEEGLDCLADVRAQHLQLLKTMHAIGLKWAEKYLNENESLAFRLGYHSVPSMRQLHMHVISQDFDSKHLKNKKHWNSFNSPFFRDSVDVIEEVSKHGKATVKDDDSFLDMELRCNRCQSAHPNIPRLKTHISSCQAPFPANLLENNRLVFASGKEG